MLFIPTKRTVRHGLLLDHPEDGTSRCAGCDASCCRGFPQVELTAEEYATLERLGANRLEFTLNERFFLVIEHGCEFLVGKPLRYLPAAPRHLPPLRLP
ncbi:YkgJ family cysteine cluster protein [Trichlorobacter ammonificans]|uniref:YkgJ family cysteine cluster protein n=1 Tax=Trichlorobacter ammonificans TaxID=2916410 RepID=A0ABN8HGA2_9BACT|nr:YkgJ family cysteine cluster protein [Trichlorobacter ammonificans]CAH2030178.1 protein of unknown function [Trichlorobacter ammonificans]